MKRTRTIFWLFGACALTLGACVGDAHGPEESDQEEGDVSETSQALLNVNIDVVRFLDQATFGPTPSTVASLTTQVNAVGATAAYNAWLDDQINPAVSGMTHYNALDDCRAGQPGITCLKDQFFHIAATANDQLRHRVAFALSEILVISKVDLKSDAKMAPYINILVDNAFGNYGDLLKKVAENPAMGEYLDTANNSAFNTSGQPILPNENFARELMQLFTIGLCDLNSNGTLKGGVCTPSFDTEEDVENYAHLMSGWTHDNTVNGTGTCPAQGVARNTSNYSLPMIACDLNHASEARPLLKTFGTATPPSRYMTVAGWGARAAMETPLNTTSRTSGVIDELFRHPNVGPFIGKQLIQRLVTSNPSTTYVGAVTAVFNNDGTGVRGNLGAVVKAILTHPEARNISPGARFGRIREPALYVAGLVRLLGIPPTTGIRTLSGLNTSMTGVLETGIAMKDGVQSGTTGRGLRDWAADMGQDVFASPSVFNYFPPDYPIPPTLLLGTTATIAPELAIEDTHAIAERANFANDLLYMYTTTTPAVTKFLPQMVNLAALPNTPTEMTDWCNAFMMHNAMPTAMYNMIKDVALNGLTGDALKRRAIYLVATSSEYQVAR